VAGNPGLDRPTCRPIVSAMTKLADIEGAALPLPDKERLHLADKLLGSLPPPPAASEPDEILAEALRRDAELESGQVSGAKGMSQ